MTAFLAPNQCGGMWRSLENLVSDSDWTKDFGCDELIYKAVI